MALARAQVARFHAEGFVTGILNEYPENILMGPLEPGARPDFPDRREVPP